MDVLKLLEPEIGSAASRSTRNFKPDCPSSAWTPVQIKQVFYNLIKNAYQAIPPAGEPS